MSKFADGFLCKGLNGRIVGDVSWHGNGTPTGSANFCGNAFNFIDSSCCTDNCSSCFGQSLGNAFADTATGSGHDCDIVGQIK
jgi:hypothetical protein